MAAHQQLYNHEFHGQQIKCYYAQVSQLVCESCSFTDAVLWLGFSDATCCYQGITPCVGSRA